jgi:hypothetical protein
LAPLSGGITITLTVSASAARLQPGAYGPGIVFTNLSNGRAARVSPQS